MTYLPEKLLQLEFLLKTITQCRLAKNDNCGTAISIRFLDHPVQRVCEILTTVPRSEGLACVTAVNVGKTYTFAVPDSDGNCDPEPLNLSILLYSLLGAELHMGDSELAAGEVAVKPITLTDVGCRPNTADKGDMTVPMMDCQGQTVAVVSVRVRAWISGTVTATSIGLPPLSRPISADACQKKPTVSCTNLIRKPTSCYSKPHAWEPTLCCNKPPAPTSCCNKLPTQTPRCNKPLAWQSKSCCDKKPPVLESTTCCNKPPVRVPLSPCRRQCVKVCSGIDQSERSAIDQPHQQNTDIKCEINGRKKIDFRIHKKHCNPCDAHRKIIREMNKFISKVNTVVKARICQQ